MPSGPSRMLLFILFSAHCSTDNLGICHIVALQELVQFGWTMLDVMEQKNVLMIVTFPALE